MSECIADLLLLFERGLRPASMFHIETANRAAVANVGGQVLVTMPTRAGDLAEVRFLGGKFRVIVE